MRLKIESYIIDCIEKEQSPSFIRGVLRLISAGFKLSVWLKNLAFDQGLIGQKKPSVPVVSIGNIIAGGTGKTELVRKMAKELASKKKISILLRGYRSEMEKQGGVFHLKEGVSLDPKLCGDEAYLLRKDLPEGLLFVGKDRCLSAQKAAKNGADLILLDDGMQFRRLYRDLEIVMLHAGDLYGKGFFLPRGLLRDFPKRLSSADYIFVNHVESNDHFKALKRKIGEKSKAPLIGVRMSPQAIRGRGGKLYKQASRLKVALFCGLGKPSSFFKTVEKMGAQIGEKLIVPDHRTPDESVLKKWALLAREKGCELLLCSEKDWVKLPAKSGLPLPVARVQARMEVAFNLEGYEELLSRVLSLTSDRKSA